MACLEKYGIHAWDMVYVGDGEVRDVVILVRNEGLTYWRCCLLSDEQRGNRAETGWKMSSPVISLHLPRALMRLS